MFQIKPNNEYGKALWALWHEGKKIAVDDDRRILANLAALMVKEAAEQPGT